MIDLEDYAGKRIEVELEGERFRGRVVRGPARQPLLLEERGEIGSKRSDAHQRLRMLRTWTQRQLEQAVLHKILPMSEPRDRKKRRKVTEWSETVAMAEGDPAIPPRDWTGGLLAWAEVVYAARRKVERSRKAMMQALREAAG
jgi:hypothetical protein